MSIIKVKRRQSPELWWDDYARYLKSSEWQEIRAKIFKLRGRKCERCGKTSGPIQLHHKSYHRGGGELDSDVEVLCIECHEKQHATQKHKREYDRSWVLDTIPAPPLTPTDRASLTYVPPVALLGKAKRR